MSARQVTSKFGTGGAAKSCCHFQHTPAAAAFTSTPCFSKARMAGTSCRLAASISHPNVVYIYGSEEIETGPVNITRATVSGDGLRVRLRTEGRRELYVHELRAEGVRSAGGAKLDHPDAYYTLNRRALIFGDAGGIP